MRLRSLVGQLRFTGKYQLPYLIGNYQYDPLPSPTCIRLLEIAPNSGNNFIQCSLRTFELQDAPSFRALSYTWGDSGVKIASSAREGRFSAKAQGDAASGVESELFEQPRRRSIVCDGRLIKVTSNLRDALRMLASAAQMPKMPQTPSYYWIDALCMDQSNIPERNEQVERMGDVFRKADGVIVWLGKEDDFTKDALKTMRTIAATSEVSWPNVSYTSFYDADSTCHAQRPNLSYHNWLGFMVLINRPWFKRAWVVQEIALAKNAVVVCGKQVFPWDILSKTLSFIKATKWYHHLHTEKMKHVTQLQKQPGIYKPVLRAKISVGISPIYINETRVAMSTPSEPTNLPIAQPPPLRMLLDKHRFASSSDPRDKVYAFLGLADRTMSPFRTHPAALTPDYNLSVQEVYTETARVLLASYKNLSLLSHVEDPSLRRIDNLPSWVPDLSVPLDPYPLRYRGPGFWRASGSRKWTPNIPRMAQGFLDVQGYCLDEINEASILLDESSDPSASWASIVKLALALNLPYPNPALSRSRPSRVEILWRTITTDIYAHIHPAPTAVGSLFIDYILNLQVRHRLMPWSGNEAFQPHHSPLSDSIYPEWQTLLSLEPSESPYSLEKYRGRLTSMVESMFNGSYSPIGLAQLQHELDQSGGKKRRVFKTRRGYMGTGPRSLQCGDEVWILHRAGLPMVLRRQPNGNYRFIGEAFVYGVMHGEALHLNLPREAISLE
ncbi:heterokaryon incompatibility protein-domain-containing protein [Paraphoma chrysanthemicola]|uniref:Heterokaryon incompatibility protein-domain-containing protein n=1 Tax=Paraphoma chrysanthemicola TaxID=798071 RepID=A0A8K0R5N0_9PLEO|nr:heterokaryon incompatibility protein-domain-containing protein [Paraphoma chrysanthemicola]